ncbi:MAG: 50S ribosomal protein L4 [Alphaproteobacteria bacterium]|nr:50S ribosomal protein L4 [Alphaproteobacteria bacterium]
MDPKLRSENIEINKKTIGLIHKVYLAQLKTSKKYTASTKTKSEVRGGGRKPWRQKGSGQARAGSKRSPLWVGGGVIFGPKPRTVIKKINKKEKKLAILSAFYLKKKELTFVDDKAFDTNVSTIKTKNILKFLSKLNIKAEERVLFILDKPNKEFWLASRNLKNVEITVANCLNIKQLLQTNQIVLSNASLELINLTYGKSCT